MEDSLRREQKGQWIKVAKRTPHKPEMLAIAAECRVDLPTAFLAWFDFYAWLDGETTDGKIYGYSEFQLDGKAGIPGFCRAMQSVGWLFNLGDHWEIANFTAYNGAGAKQRALLAKRVDKCRDNFVIDEVGHQ